MKIENIPFQDLYYYIGKGSFLKKVLAYIYYASKVA